MIFCIISCNNTPPNSFNLEGYAEGIKDSENLILYYNSLQNGEWCEIADTAKIINGKFSFKGIIDELTVAELCFEEPKQVVISVQLFLEPTKMKLLIDKNKPYSYQLSGTKVEEESIELRKELEPYDKIIHEDLLHLAEIISQIHLNDNNISVRDSLINKHFKTTIEAMFAPSQKISDITRDFVLTHPAYRIVPGLLSTLRCPIDTIKSIYSIIPEQSKFSLMGKFVYRKIEFEENKKKLLSRMLCS